MKLSAPIFRLKRRAKLMAREAKIPLAEALNRVAAGEGYNSWSLLAARYAERDPAPAILARLSPGDMLLVAARPTQGKTTLALQMLAEAAKAGRPCAFFTLEYTTAEAREVLRSVGVDAEAPGLLLDTSNDISANYMIAKLQGFAPGALVVVDYLQALDHERDKPPLAAQVAALKAFARGAGVTFVVISQIDRHYDAAVKALPDVGDVRLPNRADIGLFNKTCFLHDGELIFSGDGIAR